MGEHGPDNQAKQTGDESDRPAGPLRTLTSLFDGLTGLTNSIAKFVTAVLALVVIIGGGYLAFGPSGNDDPATNNATNSLVSSTTEAGTSSAVEQAPDPALPDLSDVPIITVVPQPNAAGCTIVISNPLVDLHSEPDTFSPTILRVDAGAYSVDAETTTIFGPTKQIWLQITVSGQTGWVRDSTFNIATKSEECFD